MKKLIPILLCVVMLLLTITACDSDSDEGSKATKARAGVYITVIDAQGEIAVAAERLTVTDADEDGALTINDALTLIHDKHYPGGAAAGYASSDGRITKLWGNDSAGSYGCYYNNAAALSLSDTVKNSAYIAAFVYSDTINLSDHYSYFDKCVEFFDEGDEITLTYYEEILDAQSKPAARPVEGAVITIDGEATDVRTDAEGKATVIFPGSSAHVISASVEGKTLVKPVFSACMKQIGDADGDGKITILDATRIQRWLADMATDNEIAYGNADADRSGKITVLDATTIQRYLVNLIDEL